MDITVCERQREIKLSVLKNIFFLAFRQATLFMIGREKSGLLSKIASENFDSIHAFRQKYLKFVLLADTLKNSDLKSYPQKYVYSSLCTGPMRMSLIAVSCDAVPFHVYSMPCFRAPPTVSVHFRNGQWWKQCRRHSSQSHVGLEDTTK